MFANFVFLIALYYVFVQCVMMRTMRGGWRVASFVPIPVICLAMCVSVVPGVIDPVASALLMMFIVPLGTLYLLVVAAAWIVRARGFAWVPQRSTSAP